MKNIVMVLLAALIALLVVTGCSKTTTCEECGQVKKCKRYTVVMLGETKKAYLCDECHLLALGLLPLVGGTIK